MIRRIMLQALRWSMIFSENRFPLFRIMLEMNCASHCSTKPRSKWSAWRNEARFGTRRPPLQASRLGAWKLPRRRIGRHDLLADRPQRDAGKLQMRPGERNADDGDRQQDRGDEMAE